MQNISDIKIMHKHCGGCEAPKCAEGVVLLFGAGDAFSACFVVVKQFCGRLRPIAFTGLTYDFS